MSRARRIAIFVDRPDWHARGLAAAFARRGAEGVLVALADCGFAPGPGPGLVLPGFADALPDGAFVRCVPGGSFEQVTMRLGVLHALRECGVPVCNDARAIERCVDKSTTTFLLARAGLPTPPTWTCEAPERAAALVEAESGPGRPLVLKPLFGSQGRGLRLIERPDDLPPPEEVAGVYYLQRYVDVGGDGWRDVRVLVAAGRAVAAMLRHGAQWITNVRQGAECEPMVPDEALAGLAVRAADAVGAGYAGVDVIRDRDGACHVLEVNSMPAWSALQRVSDVDVTQAIADGFLSLLDRDAGRRPALHRVAGD